mmetsp:Transcript_14871/g.45026  ORF Transcript_14871/g.45026 Transcript_14871/m.45026 type:complete len:99 (-) Transcript_14871:2084-2380(-)
MAVVSSSSSSSSCPSRLLRERFPNHRKQTKTPFLVERSPSYRKNQLEATPDEDRARLRRGRKEDEHLYIHSYMRSCSRVENARTTASTSAKEDGRTTD